MTYEDLTASDGGNTIIYDNTPRELKGRLIKNRLYLALFLFFMGGMVYGAALVSISSADVIDSLGFITQGFIGSRAGQPLVTTFISSITSSGTLLLLLYLLGFFAIAHPVSMLIPAFRGLGLGLSMGYLYSYYGLKGALFCLALILPHAVISTPLLILACAQSIKFSNKFLSLLVPSLKINLSPKMLHTYCMRFLLIFAGLIAAAFVDTVCVALFSRYFIF